MAKKKVEVSWLDSMKEFTEGKNISREVMRNILEESIKNVLAKIYGTDENCEVILNDQKGDFEIYRNLIVVENGCVTDENREIAYADVVARGEDVEVGGTYIESVDFKVFGRRAVINLRQALASKVLDIQKQNFCATFEERIGQVIVADVYQVWKREVLLIDEEGNELHLPKEEQIPGDFFRKGEPVRAVIIRVENENNNPKVIVSRTSSEFLRRLLEQNVPEIGDGLITIKSIARMPGERAKIAVESYDERIDPVGACVGVNGSRVKGIVRELKGENIDVTTYTSNMALFVQRALSPAKVSAIAFGPEVEEGEQRFVEVYLRPEEVALAIGKNASNLKLAAMLTGFKIEVFRDGEDEDAEEDIYLDEFKDEIAEWVIDTLKEKGGCTTAKAVLAKSREELIELTDLEDITIDHVIEVLSEEFSDEEVEDEE